MSWHENVHAHGCIDKWFKGQKWPNVNWYGKRRSIARLAYEWSTHQMQAALHLMPNALWVFNQETAREATELTTHWSLLLICLQKRIINWRAMPRTIDIGWSSTLSELSVIKSGFCIKMQLSRDSHGPHCDWCARLSCRISSIDAAI